MRPGSESTHNAAICQPKFDPPPQKMVPGGGGSKSKNHLAEVVRSKPRRPVCRGKRHIPPHFRDFWAYSRTLPQGVELLVQPLVKSLFCPINASPNEFLVGTPPDPPT